MGKLLDSALDSVVELTRPVQDLRDELAACAEHIEHLAARVQQLTVALAIVANNQAEHHVLIERLFNVQDAILKKLGEGGIDTSMPSIDGPTKPTGDAKKAN